MNLSILNPLSRKSNANSQSGSLPILIGALWVCLLALGLGKQFGIDPNQFFLWGSVLLEALTVAVWLSRPKKRENPAASNKDGLSSKLLMVLGIIFQVVSVWASGTGLGELWTLGFVLAAGVTISVTVPLNQTLKVLPLIGFMILTISWILEFTSISNKAFISGYSINPLGYRFMGIMAHPNLMGFLAILTLALYLSKEKPNWWIISFTSLTLLATEYRGGIVAALIVFMAFMSTRKIRYKGIVMAIGAIVTLFMLVVISRPRTNEADSLTGRSQIWTICQNLIMSKPIFGSGPRTIEKLYGSDTVEWFRPFHCHNQLLDDLTNFGIVGGLFTICGLLVFAITQFRRKNYQLAFAFLSILVCGLFESPVRYFSPSGYLFIPAFTLICIFGRLVQPETDSQKLKNKRQV